MAVCLMATPAAAADGVSGVVQDFFEWSVNAQRETGDAFWRAIYGDSWNPDGGFTDGAGADRTELSEKYNGYVMDVETDFGTTDFLNNGGFRRYFGVSDVRNALNLSSFTWSYTLPYVNITAIPNATANESYFIPYLTPLVNGNYYAQVVSGFSYAGTVPYTVVAPNQNGYAMWGGENLAPNAEFGWLRPTSGSTLNHQVSVRIGAVTKDVLFNAKMSFFVDIRPDEGYAAVSTLDVTDSSRAGSIAGDVYVVNENGEETVYNDYSVVNETTNIYNDPISGTERPMEDWAYDYIERQYNITLEDGANVTIKYGDENIEIVEGDSIETLNYGSGSSGEGGGEGGGSGIGDAIANLFTVLGEIIFGLITALINLATRALDALTGLFDLFGQLVETIIGFFGGFTDFLAGVFPFLPEETFTIFNFGLILLVAATVFRKFLK